jgi:hypothetical protein
LCVRLKDTRPMTNEATYVAQIAAHDSYDPFGKSGS